MELRKAIQKICAERLIKDVGIFNLVVATSPYYRTAPTVVLQLLTSFLIGGYLDYIRVIIGKSEKV